MVVRGQLHIRVRGLLVAFQHFIRETLGDLVPLAVMEDEDLSILLQFSVEATIGAPIRGHIAALRRDNKDEGVLELL